MPQDKTLTDRIGISTFVLHSMDIWETINLLERNGFGIEIHLNTFDAVIGNPHPLTHVGIWPRSFGSEERARLRERLSGFPTVTVHGTPFDLNISANNPGIRNESIFQYEEAMDFANDIGCKTVTYHLGRATCQITSDDEYLEHHVTFAERITRRAEQYGMRTGYENGDDNPEFFLKIMERVNSPHWGHLLDIGHCLGLKGDTQTVLKWINMLGPERIVQIHAHNVIAWTATQSGRIDHYPFETGTCIEMMPVFRRLKEVGYEGPIIFEILQTTAQEVIDACKRARNIICQAWNGETTPEKATRT